MTKVIMVDPSCGWRYGFPKVYDWDEVVESRHEWFIRNGYPKDKLDLLELGCRFWEEEY